MSTPNQHEDRQVDAITAFAQKKFGHLDKVLIDKKSGKNLNRVQFTEMDRFARAGDTVIIHSPDRPARSLKDLINQLDDWRERGIEVRFISQPEFDQRNATSTLTLQILAAVAELERQLILGRRREGIEAAKARGKYKETRKITPEQAAEIRVRHAEGVRRSRLAKDYGVSGSTIYNVVRRRGIYGTPEHQGQLEHESDLLEPNV